MLADRRSFLLPAVWAADVLFQRQLRSAPEVWGRIFGLGLILTPLPGGV